MKPNVNNNQNRLARMFLLLSGVFVVTAAAVGTEIYSNSIQRIERAEQDSAVLDRLAQASRLYVLVHELNNGHTAEARQFVKLALAGEMRQAQKLAATANPAAVAEVQVTLAQLARDEKAHPEYYALDQTKGLKARSIQIARHDVKP